MKWASLLGAIVLLPPLEAGATTREVWPGGCIQDTINVSSSGDTVVVHAGTYYESISLKAGVTVEPAGDGLTEIDGQNASRTVYFSGDGQRMSFGGPRGWFRIHGATSCGLRFMSCKKLNVRKIEVISPNVTQAGVYCSLADTSVYVDSLRVHGQTSLAESGGGLVVYMGEYPPTQEGDYPVLRDAWIWDVDGAGVRITSYVGCVTRLILDGVRIQNCTRGMFIGDVDVKLQGDWVEEAGRGVAVETFWSAAYTHSFELDDVYFENCDTAAVTTVSFANILCPTITNCEFHSCGNGIKVYGGCFGSVKHCEFEDIDDTGIEVAGSTTQLTIGGALADSCRFDKVYGTSIHVGSGATATIKNCRLDGSYECFEGIAAVQVASATVRRCKIRDYDLIPVPPMAFIVGRGVYVYGPAADLGHASPPDSGNIWFDNPARDLYYSGHPRQIPSTLYAEYNWWGEAPPDSDSFGGGWKNHIDYDPWLTGAPPGVPPAPVGGPAVAGAVALTCIRPNPAVGTVEFSYELPSAGNVEVAVWDLRGHRIRTLLQGKAPAGASTVAWDGADDLGNPAAQGAYVCRLSSSAGGATRRFVLVR